MYTTKRAQPKQSWTYPDGEVTVFADDGREVATFNEKEFPGFAEKYVAMMNEMAKNWEHFMSGGVKPAFRVEDLSSGHIPSDMKVMQIKVPDPCVFTEKEVRPPQGLPKPGDPYFDVGADPPRTDPPKQLKELTNMTVSLHWDPPDMVVEKAEFTIPEHRAEEFTKRLVKLADQDGNVQIEEAVSLVHECEGWLSHFIPAGAIEGEMPQMTLSVTPEKMIDQGRKAIEEWREADDKFVKEQGEKLKQWKDANEIKPLVSEEEAKAYNVKPLDASPPTVGFVDTPKNATGAEDWGWLPNEPCRFCHRTGKVYFLRDEGPEGQTGLSPIRCDNCGRSWTPDSPSA